MTAWKMNEEKKKMKGKAKGRERRRKSGKEQGKEMGKKQKKKGIYNVYATSTMNIRVSAKILLVLLSTGKFHWNLSYFQNIVFHLIFCKIL